MPDNEMEKWLSNHPDFDAKEEIPINKKQSSSKKKNEIPEIDLHGLILAKAFPKITQFIRNQPLFIQKVRIIHGKGLHSNADQQGILREEVRKWLQKLKDKKELIKDFSYAPPQEGGWGATIVWLIR